MSKYKGIVKWSKSIYGDALAIIDNIYESDTVEDFAYYDVRGLPLSWEVYRDELEKIKHALEQAQKQEKLLELYREYFKIKSLPTNEVDIITFDRLLEIKEQIKEIEEWHLKN